jgi:hypothetical protein
LKRRKLADRFSLEILSRFTRGGRFHAHGKECAQEQNTRAPKLSMSKAFVENPRGERHRDRGTKKLQGLGQRDSDFVDCYIIQNVGKCDAGDSGDY